MNLVTPREVEYLPSVLKARKNLKLKLTKRQVNILIGAVLGDGYISPRGQIQLEHSDKSKPYLFWKYAELKNLAYGRPSLVGRIDKRNGAEYKSYRFWLKQYFRPWRKYFYHEKDKIFPKGLKLTPLALAVWYMDDGCFSDKRCTISIENFSVGSRLAIQAALKKSFGLDSYIRSNGKLAMRTRCHEAFFKIVKPYIHKSMRYKIL